MLHLNSTAAAALNSGSHQTTTTTSAPLYSSSSSSAAVELQNKSCSTKRQYRPYFSSLPEPSPKRATLSPPSSAAAATTNFPGDKRILGFSKLPLPANVLSPSSSSSTSLHRTVSDPVNTPGVRNFSDQAPTSLGNFLNNRLPRSYAANSVATSPSQPLYRSVSDPTPASYQPAGAATTTPPRPPAESPDTEKLRRIKDRLREMNQWLNAFIDEGEEDSGSEDNDNLPKDECEVSEVVTEIEEEEEEGPSGEEAVWVERYGESLILRFKCPCSKGYQILLNGNNCYYKLTAF